LPHQQASFGVPGLHGIERRRLLPQKRRLSLLGSAAQAGLLLALRHAKAGHQAARLFTLGAQFEFAVLEQPQAPSDGARGVHDGVQKLSLERRGRWSRYCQFHQPARYRPKADLFLGQRCPR